MNMSLSPKLKIILRIVHRARGLKTVSETWIEFRKEIKVIKTVQIKEQIELTKTMRLDQFDLVAIKIETLPSRNSYLRYLRELEKRKLLRLHKDGDNKQSHTYPAVTEKADPFLKEESVIQKIFGI